MFRSYIGATRLLALDRAFIYVYIFGGVEAGVAGQAGAVLIARRVPGCLHEVHAPEVARPHCVRPLGKGVASRHLRIYYGRGQRGDRGEI